MEYGVIKGVEKELSRLIQGTLSIRFESYAESLKLLDGVFELGCNAFDTAHAYNKGETEIVLGKWMAQRNNREKIFIIDKGIDYSQENVKLVPKDITANLLESLERLQTDYIDLYLLHRDDPHVHVEPLIDILNEHKHAGRIHAFGASNWSVARITQANHYAEKNGLEGFVASSPQFSLAIQYENPYPGAYSLRALGTENEIERYRQSQLALLTWSSLARGFLTGRITRENMNSLTDHQLKKSARCYGYEKNFQRLERAKEIAKQKNCTLPQIALAFVLNQPLHIFALIGPRTVAEFAENMKALEIKLTAEELDWLDLKND